LVGKKLPPASTPKPLEQQMQVELRHHERRRMSSSKYPKEYYSI